MTKDWIDDRDEIRVDDCIDELNQDQHATLATRHCRASGQAKMELSDYDIVLRRVLYDRDDIWLKTPQQIARWLRLCRANAATRFAA